MSDRDGTRRPFRLPLGSNAVPGDVALELEFHLAERVDELIAAGMSREEAMREAAARFGDWPAIGAEVTRIARRRAHRERMTEALGAWGRDLRLAFRSLGKQPAFTLTALLTLALGLGANAAIFSAVYGVLLRPLDTPHLDRIEVVQQDVPGLNLFGTQVSVPEVRDLAEHDDVFQALGGSAGATFILAGPAEPERVLGVQTVGRLFDVLGARAEFGRLYRPEAGEPGAPRVVVLTHGFWRRWFGADTAAVGGTLEMNGIPYQVVGVLSPSFRFRPNAQVYVPYPITPALLQQRGSWTTTAIGLRQPGLSPEQFASRLSGITAEWQADPSKAYPAEMKRSLVAAPFVDWQAGELKGVLQVLFGAVVLVLLIACTNVANLQLVRSIAREKELSVRAALGAGRWALMRERFVESSVLAAGGGLLGLALAALLLRLVAGLESVSYFSLRTLTLRPAVLLFAGGVTALAAVGFGLLPTWRAGRPRLLPVLGEAARGSSAGPSKGRLLIASVAVQVALSLVLLLGAGLLVRSLSRLLQMDPGFRPAQVLTFRVALPSASYPTPADRATFFRGLTERLLGLPGVEAAGAISDLPFGDGRNSSPFRVERRPVPPGAPDRHADMRYVAGDYFKTMGIPLVAGRGFSAEDRAGGPLAVVIDDALAREVFGDESPLGYRLNQGLDATIVGVVGSVKHGDLREDDKATVYYPYAQTPWYSGLYLTVRTPEAETILPLAKAAVRDMDPALPVYDIRAMQERIDRSLGTRRFALIVLSSFAALALLLALVGVYGVLSYSTRQRAHELGIRMALGAVPRDLLRMVLRQGMAVAGAGLALGLVAFLVLARLLASLVYGVSPRDPVTIALGAGILLAGALAAAFLPARRAARGDPASILREE